MKKYQEVATPAEAHRLFEPPLQNVHRIHGSVATPAEAHRLFELSAYVRAYDFGSCCYPR